MAFGHTCVSCTACVLSKQLWSLKAFHKNPWAVHGMESVKISQPHFVKMPKVHFSVRFEILSRSCQFFKLSRKMFHTCTTYSDMDWQGPSLWIFTYSSSLSSLNPLIGVSWARLGIQLLWPPNLWFLLPEFWSYISILNIISNNHFHIQSYIHMFTAKHHRIPGYPSHTVHLYTPSIIKQ